MSGTKNTYYIIIIITYCKAPYHIISYHIAVISVVIKGYIVIWTKNYVLLKDRKKYYHVNTI